MQAAPIPGDETERLLALAAYEVLDTPPETKFDELARLAAITLAVPIALVSFVDAKRQWFKARHGLDVAETPRELAFCAHVVSEGIPLVVRDAHADVRFADNPLVTGAPHVRFYAGVPLRTPEGYVLGTMCAIDHTPRDPSPLQLEALGLLANQVIAALELQRTARQLLDRERRLATVLDTMDEGVVMHAADGSIVLQNRAAATFLGNELDEPADRKTLLSEWRAFHEDGTPFPVPEQPSETSLRTGRAVSDVVMRIESPAKQQRWISLNARPVTEPGEPRPYASIVTFRDITMQRELADRLANHQRLVTTGTLAAGVGHEINNPLAYMLTNVALALEELEELAEGSPSRRLSEIVTMLESAREGGERVKRIVRGLKSLARENTELSPVDLGMIVRAAMPMTSHELRTRATVELDLPTGALVTGDDSRLSQVVINLVINAAQAFATADPTRNRIIVRARVEGDVVLEVIDNGPGIAPDVLPRIFDPFFTTKDIGVGTGLGLSISHGIIAALGGQLTCETEVGRGTTFRIRLPTAAPAPQSEVAKPITLGRMLLVDDEQVILTTLRRIFQHDFVVVAYEDPRAALGLVKSGEDFDVIFCDISMPYLTGMQFYDEVAATRPELLERIVFISGDLMRDDTRRFLQRVPNERLEKPVDIQRLRGLARRFLRR